MSNREHRTISVDVDLWNKWMHFVIDNYGSFRKSSHALEEAMNLLMCAEKAE